LDKVSYIKLYKLQDKILDVIFSQKTEFYLTGGTCLNRFFYEKRYSDDLDFFTFNSSTFFYSITEILESFKNKDIKFEKIVDSKSFVRVNILEKGLILQIDFVNDSVNRHGEFIFINNYKLDNPLNILSNKITAVLGRDNPKDIFDIYLISKNTKFNWETIISNAKTKMIFQKDELIYRLETFPFYFLKNIKLIDNDFLNGIEEEFPLIINDILENNKNSLFERELNATK
jgi:predicted nucleotidyltransferase component of viral defense system